jgi:hypothetical protein
MLFYCEKCATLFLNEPKFILLFYFCINPDAIVFRKTHRRRDLSVWIALGRDSWESFKILTTDTYAITETVPMVYPVLITLLYGLLYKIQGLELVIFLHALVPAAWVLLWYTFLKKHSPRYKNSNSIWDFYSYIALIAALLGSSLIFVSRPALVATIPLLFCYYLLSTANDQVLSKKNILMLFCVELVWVNLHGSFSILPMMLGWQGFFQLLQGKKELFLNRLVTGLAAFGAILINPFTWQVIPYTWETARISVQRGLDEWFPPYLMSYPFASGYFYFFSALFLIYSVYRIKNSKRWLHWLSDPFILFWISGFFAIRNTFIIFLVLPIFIFNKILVSPKKEAPPVKDSSIANAIIISVIIFITILLSPFAKHRISPWLSTEYKAIYNKNYRVEKINNYLATQDGTIFNSWQFGSDLILTQKNKIFIDTRNIIYTDKVNEEYEGFMAKPNHYSYIITKYNLRYFVIHKNQVVLNTWLSQQPEIQLQLVDGPAFLYEKTH